MCLCNVYVIKVEWVEKDVSGKIIIIYCIYDFEILGKNFVDGCKVKGVIYWVFVIYVKFVEFCLYDCLFIVLNFGVEEEIESVLNLNFLVVKYGFVELSLVNVKVE